MGSHALKKKNQVNTKSALGLGPVLGPGVKVRGAGWLRHQGSLQGEVTAEVPFALHFQVSHFPVPSLRVHLLSDCLCLLAPVSSLACWGQPPDVLDLRSLPPAL